MHDCSPLPSFPCFCPTALGRFTYAFGLSNSGHFISCRLVHTNLLQVPVSLLCPLLMKKARVVALKKRAACFVLHLLVAAAFPQCICCQVVKLSCKSLPCTSQLRGISGPLNQLTFALFSTERHGSVPMPFLSRRIVSHSITVFTPQQ